MGVSVSRKHSLWRPRVRFSSRDVYACTPVGELREMDENARWCSDPSIVVSFPLFAVRTEQLERRYEQRKSALKEQI